MPTKPLWTMLSTAAITAAAALSVPITSSAAPSGRDTDSARFVDDSYIVELADAPVVAYKGGIKGYAATKPRAGQKIDPNSAKVVNYRAYLDGKHGAFAASVGAEKFYGYGYSFNGFAARLTAAQAEKLAAMPGVIAISRDEIREKDTSTTPTFLGLNDANGIWDRLGGTGNAGEGVIIGIIDSGIWPESMSFSDRTGENGNASKDGKLAYQQIPGWHGKCTPGEQFNASLCNQKLIGAQYFNAGWGGNAGIDAQRPWEFNSVRDYNGHGTHTASTAGGNAGVPVTVQGVAYGAINGIAPHARIAAYKALWSTEDASTAGGTTSDLVAAIDQAVADGVDVINYSISGSRTNFRDPVEISFLFAADAGVFVAASAGNSGPSSSTVAHPSPWITTVAAGTHDRYSESTLTLGNGATYTGASATASGVGPVPFIYAGDAGLPGADPTAVRLCFAAVDNGGVAVLDPAMVAGKIVLCDRGITARVNKSLAVRDAGGVGMVLANVSPASLNADFHSVPSVHITDVNRVPVLAYALTPGATAQIGPSVQVGTAAPFTASFSSRGPLQASGSLLKPDLIAPGQDVLAAVAPPGNGGQDFGLYSGTSMSSPHVAGLAALFKQLHPSWSPMMIKSALMTTGYDVLDGGTPAPNTNPVLIFRQGAGHVDPNKAMDPGLVFNSGFNDWLAFICATQPSGLDSTCNALWGAGYSRNASDFNGPSIAFGALPGTQTVTRTVTSVGSHPSTYNVSFSGSTISAVVSPSSFTINPGQRQTLSITVTRTTAALNAYAGGQLTLSDGTHVVRVPVVARPVALGAPTEVNGSFDVLFGYTGPFNATARGLVAAALTDGTVADDPTDGGCSLSTPNAELIPVVIPAGTSYARFQLFDADVTAGADIDLCVANAAGTIVGASGSGTSAEVVSLLNPAAGNYTVVVQGWGVAGTSPFKLHTWLLGTTDAGNMTVAAPASATQGATGTIDLSFTGLTPGMKYLGSVAYGGTTGLPSPTIVRVDP